MRKPILAPILVVLLSLCVPAPAMPGATSGHGPRSGGQPTVDVSRLEKKVHTLINLERKRAGVPDLTWNPALQRIARDHSREMATRNFFSHTDPNGRSFSERYQDAGFDCAIRTSAASTCLGGENLALDALYSSISWRNGRRKPTWNTEDQIASSVVRQWMTSPGHRRNILTRSYRQQGIGMAIDQDGRVLITENFC